MAEVPAAPDPPKPREFIRDVVLDWNIIHYWISKDMRAGIQPIIDELDKANIRFTISDITVYEAQCRMPIGKHMEAHSAIQGLPRYQADADAMLMAAILTSCYGQHEHTKSHASEISFQDTLNAATAINNDALLLTADYNDYPRPFFEEVARWPMRDKQGRLYKIYLFSPDLTHIGEMSGKWHQAALDNAAHAEEQRKQKEAKAQSKASRVK